MAITDSLISFWELEEASGTRVDAVTASANNLTPINAPSNVAGRVGNALQNSYSAGKRLEIASSSSLSCGNIDHTYCAWVWFDSKPADVMSIVSKANLGSFIGIEALSWNNAIDRFSYIFTDAGAVIICNPVANNFGSPPTGQWIFVVAWFDSAAGIGYVQVNNGTPDSAAKTGNPITNSFKFCIGGYEDNVRSWDGRIDQVGFWKRVLTSAEITWLYNANAGRSYADLIAASGPTITAFQPNGFM